MRVREIWKENKKMIWEYTFSDFFQSLTFTLPIIKRRNTLPHNSRTYVKWKGKHRGERRLIVPAGFGFGVFQAIERVLRALQFEAALLQLTTIHPSINNSTHQTQIEAELHARHWVPFGFFGCLLLLQSVEHTLEPGVLLDLSAVTAHALVHHLHTTQPAVSFALLHLQADSCAVSVTWKSASRRV